MPERFTPVRPSCWGPSFRAERVLQVPESTASPPRSWVNPGAGDSLQAEVGRLTASGTPVTSGRYGSVPVSLPKEPTALQGKWLSRGEGLQAVTWGPGTWGEEGPATPRAPSQRRVCHPAAGCGGAPQKCAETLGASPSLQAIHTTLAPDLLLEIHLQLTPKAQRAARSGEAAGYATSHYGTPSGPGRHLPHQS